MSATRDIPNGPPLHVQQAMRAVLQPLGVGVQRYLQHLSNPRGKVRIQAVIDPLPLAAVQQHTAGAQLGEVTADFRLAVFESKHQLANTELALTGDQQGSAGASLIGQTFKDFRWSEHGEYYCMWTTEYTDIHMFKANWLLQHKPTRLPGLLGEDDQSLPTEVDLKLCDPSKGNHGAPARMTL